MKRKNSRTSKREKLLNLFTKKLVVYMTAGMIAAASFSFAAVLYVRQAAETEMNQLLKTTKERMELDYHNYYSNDTCGNRNKMEMICTTELFRINEDLGFYPLSIGRRDAAVLIYDVQNGCIAEDSEYTAVMTARMPKKYQEPAEYPSDGTSENIKYEVMPLENDQFRSTGDFERVIFRLDPELTDEFKKAADSGRGFFDEIICSEVYTDTDRMLFHPVDYTINLSGEIISEGKFTRNVPEGFILRKMDDIDGHILEMGNDKESEVLKTVRNLAETTDFEGYSAEFARQYDWKRKSAGRFENSEKFMLNGKEYYLISVFTYDYSFIYPMMYAAAAVLCIIGAFVRSRIQFAELKALYFTEDYRKEMTNTLAHDLKSPLMAVSGYAENLRSGKSPEKNEHYIDSIMQNVEYMDGIIQNVLELAKLENGNINEEKEETELAELTEKLLEKYETETKERNISVNVNGILKIKADREMLSHALENLISNAVKYTSDNGKINLDFNKNGFIFENDFNGRIDMNPGDLLKPFVRGDRSRTGKKGTGLGLTIAAGILEAHGISLSLSIKDGKFTAKAVL